VFGNGTGRFVTEKDVDFAMEWIADFGRPVCLIWNTCYASAFRSMTNWGFPAGSTSIFTSTGHGLSVGDDDNEGVYTYGTTPTDRALKGGIVSEGSYYLIAFTEAIKNPANLGDDECPDCRKAHYWLLAQHKLSSMCYDDVLAKKDSFGNYVSLRMVYPIGKPLAPTGKYVFSYPVMVTN
jgi:hypothetical protein